MTCQHFVHKNPNSELFYVYFHNNNFYVRTDCSGIIDEGICTVCSLPQGLCECYPLDNIVPTGIGYRPEGEEPPQFGYFMPRYAYVGIQGSTVVSLEAGTKWEIWTPSGECDTDIKPFGDPGDVTFNPLSTGLILLDPENCELNTGNLNIEWNGSAWDIDFQFSTTCDGNSFCAGGLVANGQPLQVRWRREYEDWITKEVQKWENIGEVCGVSTQQITLSLSFEPTCRPPSTGIYCNCIDEGYNIIELNTLNTYAAPLEPGCSGKPIDIDSDCGDVQSMNSWVMYYAPYPNTVPVIDFVAYDTTNIPDGEGVEIVKIGTFATQAAAREWTCTHLRFATVGNNWPTDPNDLEYDWPYNDLYFNACPGGIGAINLIPC